MHFGQQCRKVVTWCLRKFCQKVQTKVTVPTSSKQSFLKNTYNLAFTTLLKNCSRRLFNFYLNVRKWKWTHNISSNYFFSNYLKGQLECSFNKTENGFSLKVWTFSTRHQKKNKLIFFSKTLSTRNYSRTHFLNLQNKFRSFSEISPLVVPNVCEDVTCFQKNSSQIFFLDI